MKQSTLPKRYEIQTCVNWRGPGLALYELPEGGVRHRWRCDECGASGPAEEDGAVCRRQADAHLQTEHVS